MEGRAAGLGRAPGPVETALNAARDRVASYQRQTRRISTLEGLDRRFPGYLDASVGGWLC